MRRMLLTCAFVFYSGSVCLAQRPAKILLPPDRQVAVEKSQEQLQQGLAARARGQHTEAAKHLRLAVQAEAEAYAPELPPDIDALDRLVLQELLAGNDEQARKTIDAAVRQYGADEDDWRLTHLKRLQQDVTAILGWNKAQRKKLLRVSELTSRQLELQQQSRFSDALKIADEVQTLRTELFGDQHPQAALSHYSHAVLFRLTAQLAEALNSAQLAQEILKQSYGDHHPWILLSERQIGLTYSDNARTDEAVTAFRNCQRIARQCFGEYSPQHLEHTEALATVLADSQKPADAIRQRQYGLQIAAKLYGEKSTQWAAVALPLARLQFEADDAFGARQTAEKAVAAYRAAGETDHFVYLTAIRMLIVLNGLPGPWSVERLNLANEAVTLAESLSGKDHADVAGVLQLRADLLLEADEPEEALSDLQRAIKLLKQAKATESLAFYQCLMSQHAVWHALGKFALEEKVLQDRVALAEKLFGRDHPQSAAALNRLASCYQEQNKTAEAIQTYQTLAKFWMRVEGPDSAGLGQALHMQGIEFYRQGKFESAKTAQEQAAKISKKIEGEESQNYAQRLHAVVMNCMALGELERAETLLEELRVLRQPYTGANGLADHPPYSNILMSLGTVFSETGRFPQASAAFHIAAEIRAEVHGRGHPDYEMAVRQEALIQRRLEDETGAKKLLAQLLKDVEQEESAFTPRCARIALRLAEVQAALSEVQAAEELVKKAITVLETDKTRYAGDLCQAFRQLGGLRRMLGDTRAAQEHLNHAHAMAEKLFGKTSEEVFETLKALGHLADEQGQRDETIRLFREAWELADKLYRKQDLRRLLALAQLANFYSVYRDYQNALPLYQQLVAEGREAIGPNHPDIADWSSSLSGVHEGLGQYTEAEQLLAEVARIRKTAYGEDSHLYLLTLESKAMLTGRSGNREKEVRELQAILKRKQELLGPEHSSCLASLKILGMTWNMLLEWQKAEACFRQVVEAERKLGEERIPYAEALRLLGESMGSSGRHDEAISLLEESLAIQRKLRGESHPDVAQMWKSMGDLKLELQQYDKAESFYRSALEAFDHEQLPDLTVELLQQLGHVHFGQGKPDLAGDDYRQATKINQERKGVDHPDYALSLYLAGQQHMIFGEYQTAREILEEATACRRRIFGDKHLLYAECLKALASLDTMTKHETRAITRTQQVIDILSDSEGVDNTDLAEAYLQLADCFTKVGDYEQAKPMLLKAKRLAETTPRRTPTLTSVKMNLGLTALQLGDYAFAAETLDDACDDFERFYGEDAAGPTMLRTLLMIARLSNGSPVDPEELERLQQNAQKVAAEIPMAAMGALSIVSWTHSRNGNHEAAITALDRALRIMESVTGKNHPHYFALLPMLADLQLASDQPGDAMKTLATTADGLQKHFGKQHPQTTNARHLISRLHWNQGKAAPAVKLIQEVMQDRRQTLTSVFATQSEREQYQLLRSVKASVDLFLTMTGQANDDVYGHVFPWKGAVYSAQKFSATAGRSEIYTNALTTIGQQIAVHPGGTQRDDQGVTLAELLRRREELETEIAQQASESDLSHIPMTPENLQRVLPDKSVFLDFHQYTRMPASGRLFDDGAEERIAVFILRKGAPVRRVELGSATEVSKAIDAWKQQITRRTGDSAGRALTRLIWHPVRSYLNDAETVFVSPVGAVSGVPLSALPDEQPDTWLIERFRFINVPDTHSIRSKVKRPESVSLLLVGGVDFGASPDGQAGWLRLPGTDKEVRKIRDLFAKSFDSDQLRLLTGRGASKSAFVSESKNFNCVHVATHGFFRTGRTVASPIPAGIPGVSRGATIDPATVATAQSLQAWTPSVHPGFSSGLVFSMANEQPHAGELSAFELSGVDLQNVDLMVLSACDTGTGVTSATEGTFGLRRYLHVAGVKTCVLSHWTVDDEVTGDLMAHFYQNLWQKKLSPIDALRQAQLSVLSSTAFTTSDKHHQRRAPYYWAAFELSGNWQ